jgi:hypothetical protein
MRALFVVAALVIVSPTAIADVLLAEFPSIQTQLSKAGKIPEISIGVDAHWFTFNLGPPNFLDEKAYHAMYYRSRVGIDDVGDTIEFDRNSAPYVIWHTPLDGGEQYQYHPSIQLGRCSRSR